ncbi:hypothetical protein QN386_21705 [Pseudomonas sp. CCI3.2]|uniref:hypothetical protein n=1 Tax=unclassified Pseudomonas TaxID=196821 RepID=UPI002AC954EC|nr:MULTISPECIES: hypothetical protein [unclassified Pseudomonas]MEB0079727.1 hypothetical protein [Pseudomonas sp. MH10out]MEB0103923.1 hypothetical protein [Pseudomonas sp. CCI3.2]MEB0132166.1 hypothetical protein [Pseudomonas sp. CCI2.4]MEB0157872.1 hypothetical protein [Pseudomonas sp. AH2 (2023)]MEB0169576.1 hypothetical protein [Pseudomonas sp. CCC4.4]
MTFLCLEVTGMRKPLHHPYEVRKPKHSKHDPEHGEVVTDINRPLIDVPKPQDPFVVTDTEEPDQGAGTWDTRDQREAGLPGDA